MLADLLAELCGRFPIEGITGHSDIAPGRKTDPGPFFSWGRLRSLLALHGAALADLVEPALQEDGGVCMCWPFPLSRAAGLSGTSSAGGMMFTRVCNPTLRVVGRFARDAGGRARALLLIASLAPMLIWLVSAGHLARPLDAAGWALLCGVLAASAPGRMLRWAAMAQLLLLPLTLAWIGAVAVTGMGPSTASMGSATNGAYKEVLTAARVVLGNRQFQLVAMLSAVLGVVAAWSAWCAPSRSPRLVVLCLSARLAAGFVCRSRCRGVCRLG